MTWCKASSSAGCSRLSRSGTLALTYRHERQRLDHHVRLRPARQRHSLARRVCLANSQEPINDAARGGVLDDANTENRAGQKALRSAQLPPAASTPGGLPLNNAFWSLTMV